MIDQHSCDVLAPGERVTDGQLREQGRSEVRRDGIKVGWPRTDGLMLAGSALIVVVLVVLVWWDFRPQPQVAVPSLIGMSRVAAEAQLKQSGLNVRAASEEISGQPVGTVLRTDPPAGTLLGQDGGVSLVLAMSGPPPTPAPATDPSPAAAPPQLAEPPRATVKSPTAVVPPAAVVAPPVVVPAPVVVVPPPVVVAPAPVLQQVPYLFGLDRSGAERLLGEHGLRVGWITVAASDRPAWTVLRTDPRPGTSLWPGSAVDLVLAAPRQVLVPDVVGLSQAKAAQVLSNQGLRVGTVTEEGSDQPSLYTVLRTNPRAGTAVWPGRAVDLVLAKASVALKRVPNVVGLDRSTAVKTLKAEGFKVGLVTEEESTESPGTVLRTNPAAGTQVQPGSTVDLVMAKAPLNGQAGKGNGKGDGGTGTIDPVANEGRKDG